MEAMVDADEEDAVLEYCVEPGLVRLSSTFSMNSWIESS